MRLTFICLLVSLTMTAWADNYPQEEFIDDVAQEDTTQGENLARLTFVGKDVNLIHEDGYEEKAVRNLPVVAGDALNTDRRSFAEIEFIDGSLLQVDRDSLAEFQAINEVYREESLTVVKLHRGSLFLHVNDADHLSDKQVFRIDSNDGSAYIEGPGIYRFDQMGERTRLKVYRGYAELSGEADSEMIYSGEYATIRDMYAPSRANTFNSFSSDNFERWAYDRRPWRQAKSVKYVQPHLTYYARDLDGQGDWRYLPEINDYVWCPSVATSWRPYYNGHWTRRHGRLTWVSYDNFGYLTHHYGRWSFSIDFGWYWRPGRHYSPAWVAWNSYDNYIGWCPLGYTNRPYYYTSVGFNVNIYRHHSVNWHYVTTDNFFYRGHRRAYVRHVPHHRRVITTRNIYVERDDFRSPTRLVRAIRQPTINRDRAQRINVSRGNIRVNRSQAVSVNRSTNRNVSVSRSTVSINGRDSGTRAVSRFTRQSSRDSGQRGNIVRRERGDVEIKRTTRSTVDGNRSSSVTRSRSVERNNGTSVNRSRTVERNNNGTSVNRSRTVERNNNGTSVNRSRSVERNNNGSSVNRNRTTTRENQGNSSGIRRTYRGNDDRIKTRERGSKAIPNPYRPGSRSTNGGGTTIQRNNSNGNDGGNRNQPSANRSSDRNSGTRVYRGGTTTIKRNSNGSSSTTRSRNSATTRQPRNSQPTYRNRNSSPPRNSQPTYRNSNSSRPRNSQPTYRNGNSSRPRAVKPSQPTKVERRPRSNNNSATRTSRQPSRNTSARPTTSNQRPTTQSNNNNGGSSQRAPIRRNQ